MYQPQCLGQGHKMNKIDNEQGQVLDTIPKASFPVASTMRETGASTGPTAATRCQPVNCLGEAVWPGKTHVCDAHVRCDLWLIWQGQLWCVSHREKLTKAENNFEDKLNTSARLSFLLHSPLSSPLPI